MGGGDTTKTSEEFSLNPLILNVLGEHEYLDTIIGLQWILYLISHFPQVVNNII